MKDFTDFANKVWKLRNHYEKDNVPHSKLKVRVVSQILGSVTEEGDLPPTLVINIESTDCDLLLDVSESVLEDLELFHYIPQIHDTFDVQRSVSSVLFKKH